MQDSQFLSTCKMAPNWMAMYYFGLWFSMVQCFDCILEANNGSQQLQTWNDDIVSNLNHTCQNNNESPDSSACPVWYLCSINNTCRCADTLLGVIRCDERTLTAEVMDCFCVTYSETSGTIVGACFTNCGRTLLKDYGTDGGAKEYKPLSWNKSELNSHMCGHENRDGELCGGCRENYYPMAYSYNQSCIKCENSHRNGWLYVIVAYLPLTAFYFIVLFFKINVTSSSYLHGFVFFSQTLVMQPSAQLFMVATSTQPVLHESVKVFLTILGIWNLDFFRAYTSGICLKLGTLSVLALDYTVAIYPLLLTVLSYLFIELHDRNVRIVVFIWKPFRQIFMLFRRNWNSRTSIIDAYSTFFLLSYIKLLGISADLLIPTKIYYMGSNKTTYALYYDATKPYFGKEHYPFAIIALIALTVYNIMPIFVLIVYQFSWFQKILRCLPIKHHIFNSFVDTFQGCFKDGTTPGMRDCRWFSAMFLSVRVIGYIIYGSAPNAMFYILASIALLMLLLMLVIVQPYKDALSHYMPINVVFVALVILLYISMAGINIAIIKNYHFAKICAGFVFVLCIAGIFYFSVYSVHWIITRWRFTLGVLAQIQLMKQGYDWLETRHTREDSLPSRMINPQSHATSSRDMANFSTTY